jgi:hypothetical protein
MPVHRAESFARRAGRGVRKSVVRMSATTRAKDVDADTVERASASDGTDVFRARPGGAPEKEGLGYRSERMGAAGQARAGP